MNRIIWPFVVMMISLALSSPAQEADDVQKAAREAREGYRQAREEYRQAEEDFSHIQDVEHSGITDAREQAVDARQQRDAAEARMNEAGENLGLAHQAAWDERHAEKEPPSTRVETSPSLKLPDMVPPPGQAEGAEPDLKRQAVMDGEADAVEMKRLYEVTKDPDATPEERKAAIERADEISRQGKELEREAGEKAVGPESAQEAPAGDLSSAQDKVPGAQGAVRYAEKVVTEKEHAAHMAELRYQEAQGYYEDDLEIGGAGINAEEQRRRQEELARLQQEADAANEDLAAARNDLARRKDHLDQLETKAEAARAQAEEASGKMTDKEMGDAFSDLTAPDELDQPVPKKKSEAPARKTWDEMTGDEKRDALVHGEPGSWKGHLDDLIKAQKPPVPSGLEEAEPETQAVDSSDAEVKSSSVMDSYVGKHAEKSAEKADSSVSLGSSQQDLSQASTAGDQKVKAADAVVSAGGAEAGQTKAAAAQAVAGADQKQSWGAVAADAIEASLTAGATAAGGAVGVGAAQAVTDEVFPPVSKPASVSTVSGSAVQDQPAGGAASTCAGTGGSGTSSKSAVGGGKGSKSSESAGAKSSSPPKAGESVSQTSGSQSAQGNTSAGGWTCPFCGSTAGYYLSRDHRAEDTAKNKNVPEGTLVQGSLTGLLGQRDYKCKTCGRVVRRTYDGGRVENADANGNFK
ncbi:MAG: hypothetical protein JXB04_10320 [Kiritimatiellae bacterium]|nr:hypothetical protein [Kiritimatiellia bacterium]